jgi:GTP pyrophosphokinase
LQWSLLKASLPKNFNEKEIQLIKKSFNLSKKLHKNQFRASGDPFFVHPFNVALCLSKIGMDATSIASALLHDTLEDTTISRKFIKKEFGKEVLSIVDALTKFRKIVKMEEEELESHTIQKLLLGTINDVRVIIIKLIDKLDNVKTLKFLPKEKQKKVAINTLQIYSPIAAKLGISMLEKEFDEICFPIAFPKAFKELKKTVLNERKKKRKEIELLVKELKKRFKSSGLKAEFLIDDRSFYYLLKKMNKTFKSINELYDFSVLIIKTSSIKNCYAILGIIHNMFIPVPLKLKDHIAIPGPNLYQSIHTTVIGPKGNPVKIFIRTHEMHELAREGVIALFKKKKNSKMNSNKQLTILNKLTKLKGRPISAKEFMNILRIDFLTDHIFVFTPKGKIIELPKGSTPIDFAFAISSSLGSRLGKAIVNGKTVSLKYKLKAGDIVKIVKSKKKQVKKEWLNIVKSHSAFIKIKNVLMEKKIESLKAINLVTLIISASDRIGLFRDIAAVFASHNTNIFSINFTSPKEENITKGLIVAEFKSQELLDELIEELLKIEGVNDIETTFT